MTSPNQSKSGEEIIKKAIERYIVHCEWIVGSLIPEVRTQVEKILQGRISNLINWLKTLWDSDFPEEAMIDYMTEAMRTFRQCEMAIDPTAEKKDIFQSAFEELKSRFQNDIPVSDIFKTKTADEIRTMIATAELRASK